jgi:hypothetical protein
VPNYIVFEVVEFTNKLGTVVDSCSFSSVFFMRKGGGFVFVKEKGPKGVLSGKRKGAGAEGFKESVPLFIAPKGLGLGLSSFKSRINS